eukprot:2667460-Pyramimonas_sp.AAC.1
MTSCFGVLSVNLVDRVVHPLNARVAVPRVWKICGHQLQFQRPSFQQHRGESWRVGFKSLHALSPTLVYKNSNSAARLVIARSSKRMPFHGCP